MVLASTWRIASLLCVATLWPKIPIKFEDNAYLAPTSPHLPCALSSSASDSLRTALVLLSMAFLTIL